MIAQYVFETFQTFLKPRGHELRLEKYAYVVLRKLLGFTPQKMYK